MIGLEVSIQGQGERQVVHVFVDLEVVAHVEKRIAKRIKLLEDLAKPKLSAMSLKSEYSMISTALPVYP